MQFRLLQLELPMVPVSVAGSGAPGGVTVYETVVRAGASNTLVPLPSWAVPRWPGAISAVHVGGLSVSGQPHALACYAYRYNATGSSAVAVHVAVPSRLVLNCSLQLCTV